MAGGVGGRSPASFALWQALGRGDVPTHEVQLQGRATQGVRIMNVKAGDEVAAVARIA